MKPKTPHQSIENIATPLDFPGMFRTVSRILEYNREKLSHFHPVFLWPYGIKAVFITYDRKSPDISWNHNLSYEIRQKP
jgi:hypothetical protein